MTEIEFIARKLEGYSETEGFYIMDIRKDFNGKREYALSVVPKNEKVNSNKCNLYWLCSALRGFDCDEYHFNIISALLFEENNWKLRIIETRDEVYEKKDTISEEEGKLEV